MILIFLLSLLHVLISCRKLKRLGKKIPPLFYSEFAKMETNSCFRAKNK